LEKKEKINEKKRKIRKFEKKNNFEKKKRIRIIVDCCCNPQ
jgi:hypothetical protein